MDTDMTPLRWLRRIRQEWQIESVEALARLLHVDPTDLQAWLATPARLDQGQIPPSCNGVQPLIQIRKKLGSAIHDPAEQVNWLFSPRKDFDGARPIDVMGASPEELSWLAYYLDSITSVPQSPSAGAPRSEAPRPPEPTPPAAP